METRYTYKPRLEEGVSLPLVIRDHHSVCGVAFLFLLTLLNKLTFILNSVLSLMFEFFPM